jgi:hypothetical protein
LTHAAKLGKIKVKSKVNVKNTLTKVYFINRLGNQRLNEGI